MGAESEPIEAHEGIWLARPSPAPTEGIPLAVKDLFDTAGLTTTYGSILFADHVPDRSAEALVRLERAGYVNVGKTNLHEFAWGITSENPHYGHVPNPLAADRIAGGSSGGCATAIVDGDAEAGLGSDSGGSIRIPAACVGITGFKPSHGLVPVDGCFPLAPTFDHAGPMGRSVAHCAAMLEALVPDFERDPARRVSVGVAWADRCTPLVGARIREAAALLDARAVEFPLPEAIGDAFMREVADVHRDLFAASADSYGQNVRTKIERCLQVTDAEAAAANDRRSAYRDEAEAAMGDLDLLLTPTLAFVAPPLPDDELTIREDLIRFTYPFNALGWPALALPAGAAEDGLPASVQLVGRPGRDALVLAVGAELEASLVRGTA